MELRLHFLYGLPVVALVCSLAQAQAQFTQQGPKLVATSAVGAPYEGISVSLSGDGNTAIVGGFLDNDFLGAAWVFTRSYGVWGEGPKLIGAGTSGETEQGNSVSLSGDGNTAIVGGPGDSNFAGAAWVYTRWRGGWTQQAKLVGTGAVTSPYNSEQGWSVALSGDGNTAIVGGPDDSGELGAAWVFARSGWVWRQQAKLVGTGAVGAAQQGYSVALSGDGNTAIVGGFEDNGGAGAAWVFTRWGWTWRQQGTKLVGAGAVNSSTGAQQGKSVALSGDGNTAIIGGWGDSNGAGAAWVFTRSGWTWRQQGTKLVGTGAINTSYSDAEQGASVSLSYDGNSAIVGGPGDNYLDGAAWVFTRSRGGWTQQGAKLVGSGGSGIPGQGWSVALSGEGNTAMVGGPFDNGFIGAAWVYVEPFAGRGSR